MKNMIKTFLMIALVMVFMPLQANAKSELLYSIMKKNATKDNVASTYVTSDTGISFSEVSSDENGKGLYMMGNTASDNYPILYYRGDVSNNNVIYAGFCWHIIRTTPTGGTKLMYAGVPSDGKCNNEKDALTIGKTSFNPVNGAPYYGWMYNTEDGEVNVTNSTAKEYLDNWYENNMLDHTKELEDTVWCNDREIDENSVFNARTRLEEGKPTLECQNKDDSFTVFSDKGNKKLTYPTGIINADELTYAGEVLRKTQVDTFVNIAYSYWAMTPYVMNKNMYPNSKGMLNMNTFAYSAAIRPMVSVRNTALVTSGNGSNNTPYVIGVAKQYRIHTDEYTTSDKEESEDGDIVSLSHSDRDGYKFMSYKITDMDDNDLKITVNDNKFEMPNKDIKVLSVYRLLKDFHNVTTTDENIEVGEPSVEEEQEATFKINVPHGYKIKEIILSDTEDNELDIEVLEKDGVYSFEMPNKDVVISVELEELPKHEVMGDVEGLSDDPYYLGYKVEFKVKEKANYKVKNVYFTDEDGKKLDIEVSNKDGVYSFEMPDTNVKINVEYEKEKEKSLNPLTSDNILKNIMILLLSSCGLVGVYIKRENLS